MPESPISDVQKALGLSDNKLAQSLGVTRQTIRNWKLGRTVPTFALNSLRWLMELRRLDPCNDNIPERIRVRHLTDGPGVA